MDERRLPGRAPGYKITDETREKMRTAVTEAAKSRQIKVKTPEGVFDSVTEAAAHFECSTSAIEYRCTTKEGWAYVNPYRGSRYTRAIMTPDGLFPSLKEAAAHFNTSSSNICHKLKRENSGYYYA